MRIPFVLGELLLVSVSYAMAQDNPTAVNTSATDSATTTTSTQKVAPRGYPKIEMSPGFMFIHNTLNFNNTFVIQNPIAGGAPIVANGNNSFNCAGGGGTFQYNVSSMLAIAADLGGCRFFGNTLGLSNVITGNQFTYLFGPKLTFRSSSRFTPFADLSFGGDRLSVSCNSGTTNANIACLTATGANTYSKNAFALNVGGGIDIRLSNKFSIRPVQADYLYTRFGNNCSLAVCSNNNNQNAFRLKSGIVMAWGGTYEPQ